MKTLKTFYKYKKVMLKFTSKKVVKNITSQTKTNKKKVKNITFERRRGGGRGISAKHGKNDLRASLK